MPTIPSVALLLILPLIFFGRRILTRSRPPLPPGPKGFPLIGTFFDFIRDDGSKPSWIRYLEMGNSYNSDIVHSSVLGHHTVILNSATATDELFERRSGIYSDRPEFHMMCDLTGWDWNFGFMRYSDRWRLHRKTFHQFFQSRSVNAYYPFQREAMLILFKKLMVNPDELEAHVRHHAGAIILRICYGMTSQEDQDYYVGLASRAMESIVRVGNHGTFLVDFLPWLKYVPSWFPGADFKRKAKVWADHVFELRDRPWEIMRSRVEEGTAMPCFSTKNIEKFSSQMEDMEEVIKNCSGIAYAAGSDTTVSLILSAVSLLLRHPEAQEQAQQELDAVVGNTRLPDFSDRDKLPYVEGILNETMRLHPVLPLGVSHRTRADDIYEGHFIPKGAIVIGNIAAILRDERVYPDALKFKPDRFVQEDGKPLPPNPALYQFGFGRRICPGRYLALDSTWLVIACVVATCNIIKVVDINGQEIDITSGEVDEAFFNHPKPYKCRFVPRSTKALELMQSGFENVDAHAETAVT